MGTLKAEHESYAPFALAAGMDRRRLPAEARRGLVIGPRQPRVWHRLVSRLNFRVENLGRGASISGIRLSPLPAGALVDWNKSLPAAVEFRGAGLVITGGTRRSILDTLASVRLALPRSEADNPEMVLEILMRIDGTETTAVTTIGLSDSAP